MATHKNVTLGKTNPSYIYTRQCAYLKSKQTSILKISMKIPRDVGLSEKA